MAKRKSPKIGKPRPSPTGPGKRGKKAKEQPESRIAFELEDDAEALFLQEVDGMSAGATDEDFGEQLAQFADSWPGGSSRDSSLDSGRDKELWADGGRGERRGKGRTGGSGARSRSTSKAKGSEALPLIEIDLHHHSRAEAEQLLVRRLEELRSLHRAIRVRIITGKGRRSADGQGVLVRTIHSFVSSRFRNDIEAIQPCPSTSTIDGRPLRGYFDVTFRF